MTTETFTLPEYTAGSTVFFRLFDTSGNVFDFDDNTFKSIGSATTPYVAASEQTGMGGTGKSGYTAAIDLANVNDTGTKGRYILKAYLQAGGAPADSDAALTEGLSVTVQFGELGERDVVACGEVSVKSTAGSTAQISAWLEHGGEKVGVATNGGTTFTADAGTDVITSTAHGLSDTDVLILTTSDTLPAGLAVDTPYFVRDSTTNTFKLAATSGGAAIDITDTGTGTHKWHNPTATVTLREHGSGSNLFQHSFTADDLIQGSTVTDVFEDEQASPNFSDDRQYSMIVAITENGITHTSQHNRVVIG